MSDLNAQMAVPDTAQQTPRRPMAPPGEHPFTVIGAEIANAKSSGLPLYKLRLQIGDGAYDDVWVNQPWPWDGRTERANATFRSKIRAMFHNFGWEDGRPYPQTPGEIVGVLGKQGRTNFKVEEQQGYNPKLVPLWTVRAAAPAPTAPPAPAGTPYPAAPAPAPTPAPAPAAQPAATIPGLPPEVAVAPPQAQPAQGGEPF